MPALSLFSLREDLEASLAHLRLPAAHRKHVRTTNLIERSFLEERRRTKIIPRFFDERSCLTGSNFLCRILVARLPPSGVFGILFRLRSLDNTRI